MDKEREEFIERFKLQIRSFEGMQKSLQEGIDRAKQNLKRIDEDGEPIEKVFGVPPKK